jgi:hypothetical protein
MTLTTTTMASSHAAVVGSRSSAYPTWQLPPCLDDHKAIRVRMNGTFATARRPKERSSP